MRRALILSLLIAAAMTAFVSAQGTPDFSGTWELDPARSDLGQISSAGKQMPAQTVTIIIKQTGDTLSIQRSMGNHQVIAVFKLDGSVSTNRLPSGNEAKTTMKWVGATLVGKTTTKADGSQGGVNVEITDVRSLSPDGKVMTLLVARQTPGGEVRQTFLYNRK